MAASDAPPSPATGNPPVRRSSLPGAAGAGPGTPVASVTYAASMALMHSVLPGHLFTALTPHLPLHNLHWKPDPPLSYAFGGQVLAGTPGTGPATPSGTSAAAGGSSAAAASAGTNPIRTIQSLPLSFEPFSVAQARAQQIQQRRYNPSAPQNATSQILDPAYPFVHLYLAVCPDSDTYRTTVRNEIRAWLVHIGAFTAALQVSAGSLTDDSIAAEAQGAGTSGIGGPNIKSDKHTSLPATSDPEFLIVLITPPEGMPDLSTVAEDNVGAARAGTPPVGSPLEASSGSGPPPPPPKPNKPSRSSTGSTGGTGFFSSMTASKNKGASAVLEKMRADFNANKRERVVHISRLPALPSRPVLSHSSSSVGDDMPPTPRTASAQLDPTIFMDLLTRLKECCSNSLSTVLKTRMARIRALLDSIEVLDPGPASPYWRGAAEGDAKAEEDEGAKLFAHYIQSQAFVLRCLEGLGLWEDALEGWNSVADTYMRLVLGGHDPFAPSGAAVLSAAIAQISLPMPHPALLKVSSAAALSPSTPHLVDPADMLPALPSIATAALEFRIALYTRRATIQGAYLGKVLHVLQEGANEVRAIGRNLVRLQSQRHSSRLALDAEGKDAAAPAPAAGDTPEQADGAVDEAASTDLEAEVWTYQAALQLARTCDSWFADRGSGFPGEPTSANASSSSLNLSSTAPSGPSLAQQQQNSPAFHAARAEILEVARRQLDRMGLLVGWLPAQEPWLTGFGSHASANGVRPFLLKDTAQDELSIPNAIRSLFSSREIFDLRYSSLTERVLAACMLASSSVAPSGSVLSAVPSALAAGGSTNAAGPTTGRRRHVLFLRIVLTSLDLIRGRWKEAYTSLVPLAESCAPTISGPVPIASQAMLLRSAGSAGNGWPAMEALLRAQCLQCHAALAMAQDRAWVGAVVAWLRASISARKSPSLAEFIPVAEPAEKEKEEGEQSKQTSASVKLPRVDEESMFAALRSASSSLEKEVAVSGFSPFEILPAEKVATRQRQPTTDQTESSTPAAPTLLDTDGHLLRVRVRSALATAVRVDDVRLCLTSGDREQLWFTSGKVTLLPASSGDGHQVLQLYCASYAPGTYAVDVAQVRVAKVIFQLPLLPQPTPSSGADLNTAYAPGRLLTSQGARGIPASVGLFTGLRAGMPLLIDIPEDTGALQAHIGLPEVIRLGERRSAIIEIRTGRNHVRNADVTLLLIHEAAGGGSSVLAGLAEAELLDGPEGDASKGAELVLPSSDGASAPSTDKVQLKKLPAHSKIRLRFPLLDAATLGTVRLMLSIDYYSTTIAPADDESKVNAAAATAADASVLLRRQFRRVQDLVIALPLGVNAQDFFRRELMLCKFTITSAGGSHLRVQTPGLGPVQGAEQGPDGAPALERFTVQAPVETTSPAQPFAVGPKQPASFVFRLLPTAAHSSSDDSERDPEVFELTLRYQAVSGDARAAKEELPWQTIIIPVEVPSMDLVNEVDFSFLPHNATNPSALMPALVAGQPVRACFTITSSDRWRPTQSSAEGGPTPNHTRLQDGSIVLLYEIVSDLDTWLICGSTRGTIRPKEQASELTLTLIPLRDGSLPLPQLTLKPLEPEHITTETYMINASVRVAVASQVQGRPLPLTVPGARGIHVAS
ncbi:hypothetical protein OC835_004246 [Tilletia horrida]|nr:hypothetical protein OC835_004246 [Tilletia horrida]